MNVLIKVRNEFFQLAGKSRFHRIVVITFFLAMYWCGIDLFVHDALTLNLWHDVIVVLIAVVVERCLPWGKSDKNKKL